MGGPDALTISAGWGAARGADAWGLAKGVRLVALLPAILYGRSGQNAKGIVSILKKLRSTTSDHLSAGTAEQKNIRAEHRHRCLGPAACQLGGWAARRAEPPGTGSAGRRARLQLGDALRSIPRGCWASGRVGAAACFLGWSLWLFEESPVSQLRNGGCGRRFAFVLLWEHSCQAIILHPVALQTCLFKSNLLPHN